MQIDDEYTPVSGSNADIYKSIISEYRNKEVDNLDLDEFMMVAWARRGYNESPKTQANIKYIWKRATLTLKKLSVKKKVMGWDNLATLSRYTNKKQDAFCEWYETLRPHREKQIKAQGIKGGGKYVINEWFKANSISIAIN